MALFQPNLSNSQASLLRLPPEIRRMIFFDLLVPPDSEIIKIRSICPQIFRKSSQASEIRRTTYELCRRRCPACSHRRENWRSSAHCSPVRAASTTYMRELQYPWWMTADGTGSQEYDVAPLFPEILCVNKALHGEGVELLYGSHHLFDFGLDHAAASAFLSDLGPAARACFRRTSFSWYLSHTGAPFCHLKGYEDALERWQKMCSLLATSAFQLHELRLRVCGEAAEMERASRFADSPGRLQKEDFEKATSFDGFEFIEGLLQLNVSRTLVVSPAWVQSLYQCYCPISTARLIFLHSLQQGFYEYLSEQLGLWSTPACRY